MNESERTQFLSLTDAGKLLFLARLGFDLTIAGRAYVLDRHGKDAITGLAGLNELQHTILSHICGLATDAKRYPDDVLWTVLDETAARYSINDALSAAFVFAASRSD